MIYQKFSHSLYRVSVKVNGLPLKFIFDTGASDVTISLSEALFMLKNGYLKPEDLKGSSYSQIANGDIVENTTVILKEIEVGGMKIYNTTGRISHSLEAPLLLGQSALQKLGTIQINGNVLIILNGKGNWYDKLEIIPQDEVYAEEEIYKLRYNAFLLFEERNYEKAEECYIKIFDILDKYPRIIRGNEDLLGDVYANCGALYTDMGEIDKALEVYRAGLSFSNSLLLKCNYANILYYMGNEKLSLQIYEKAINRNIKNEPELYF
ncbi:MAG: retroviral-like aspartic protease family protein [Bacteroidales bacterium]|nr:retroviral-like aspartic protease family protein [Bacteroidales bacterium]